MNKFFRFLALLAFLVLLSGLVSDGQVVTGRVRCEDALPSEICKQYDPEVLSGARPSFWFPKKVDIFELRKCPERGTDYINTRELPNPGDLSTAEVEALRQWLSDCRAKVYISGGDFRHFTGYLELLTGLAVERDSKFGQGRLEPGHPVSVGIEDLRFFCSQTGIITKPLPRERVIIATDSNRNPCIIVFRFGSSLIVYDGVTGPQTGRDRVRFILNLRQCLIGKRIPEATVNSNCNLEFTDPILLETVILQANDPNPRFLQTRLTVGEWYRLLIFSEAKISQFEAVPSQAHFRVINGTYGDFSFLNVTWQPRMRIEIFINAKEPRLGIQFLDSAYGDNTGSITIYLFRAVKRE